MVSTERFIYPVEYRYAITSFFPARHSQGCLARVLFLTWISCHKRGYFFSTKPLNRDSKSFHVMPQFVPCKNCGIRVAYTDLKPNAAGIWVCAACLSKGQKSAAPKNAVEEIVGKPFSGSMVVDNRPKAKTPSGPQMFNYKCESCNYNTQSIKDMGDKMCPYCGQKGALRLKKSSAQIIREVSEL